MQILTIGYAGKNLCEFIELLRDKDVDVVVDVRLTRISRKRGFSKTALRGALEAAGIRYRHEKQLGNPKRFRAEAKTVDDCLAMYSGYMADRWSEALQSVLADESESVVCLLCVESSSHECHRSVVASQLAEARGGVPVGNL